MPRYLDTTWNHHGKVPLKRVDTQRCVINKFFNGDLQNHDNVEYYSVKPISKEKVLQLYRSLVIPLILPSVCPIFPRARWIGGEQSISWCGLLASLHGLLKPLLLQWGAPQGLPALPQAASVVGSAAASNAVPDAGLPEAAAGDMEWEYDPVLAADAEKDLLDRATGSIDWAKINSSMRLRCARWGDRSDTCAALVCMRSVMNPCLQLMHGLLKQSGLKFERCWPDLSKSQLLAASC